MRPRFCLLPMLAEPFSLSEITLQSLSDFERDDVRHFAGTANYHTQFDCSAEVVASDRRLTLDLGDVQVMATVRINDQVVSHIWKPLFRVDVTDHVHEGTNELTVEVTTLWPNRLIGDASLPPLAEEQTSSFGQLRGSRSIPVWLYDRETTDGLADRSYSTWPHWTSTGKLLPAGLIGPVVIYSGSQVELQ